eukprot:761920-Hanusia_phi.AAC.2
MSSRQLDPRRTTERRAQDGLELASNEKELANECRKCGRSEVRCECESKNYLCSQRSETDLSLLETRERHNKRSEESKICKHERQRDSKQKLLAAKSAIVSENNELSSVVGCPPLSQDADDTDSARRCTPGSRKGGSMSASPEKKGAREHQALGASAACQRRAGTLGKEVHQRPSTNTSSQSISLEESEEVAGMEFDRQDAREHVGNKDHEARLPGNERHLRQLSDDSVALLRSIAGSLKVLEVSHLKSHTIMSAWDEKDKLFQESLLQELQDLPENIARRLSAMMSSGPQEGGQDMTARVYEERTQALKPRLAELSPIASERGSRTDRSRLKSAAMVAYSRGDVSQIQGEQLGRSLQPSRFRRVLGQEQGAARLQQNGQQKQQPLSRTGIAQPMVAPSNETIERCSDSEAEHSTALDVRDQEELYQEAVAGDPVTASGSTGQPATGTAETNRAASSLVGSASPAVAAGPPHVGHLPSPTQTGELRAHFEFYLKLENEGKVDSLFDGTQLEGGFSKTFLLEIHKFRHALALQGLDTDPGNQSGAVGGSNPLVPSASQAEEDTVVRVNGEADSNKEGEADSNKEGAPTLTAERSPAPSLAASWREDDGDDGHNDNNDNTDNGDENDGYRLDISSDDSDMDSSDLDETFSPLPRSSSRKRRNPADSAGPSERKDLASSGASTPGRQLKRRKPLQEAHQQSPARDANLSPSSILGRVATVSRANDFAAQLQASEDEEVDEEEEEEEEEEEDFGVSDPSGSGSRQRRSAEQGGGQHPIMVIRFTRDKLEALTDDDLILYLLQYYGKLRFKYRTTQDVKQTTFGSVLQDIWDVKRKNQIEPLHVLTYGEQFLYVGYWKKICNRWLWFVARKSVVNRDKRLQLTNADQEKLEFNLGDAQYHFRKAKKKEKKYHYFDLFERVEVERLKQYTNAIRKFMQKREVFVDDRQSLQAHLPEEPVLSSD